jgi:hypothetical protein
MTASKNIEEIQLHQVWLKQDFLQSLSIPNGENISVLNPGHYNKDSAGPDFKNARIKIGSFTFVGDIEIDNDYSDWKNHGHNINRNYNKVILHVCYMNKQKQNYVYSSDGRKIHSITIENNIALDHLKFNIPVGNKRKSIKNYSLKCSNDIDKIEMDFIRDYILTNGIERFKRKSERIYRRLKELKFISELKLKEPVIRFELTKEFESKEFLHSDFHEKAYWQQIFYELVFEALGYSKNKNMMRILAQSVNYNFLNQLDHSADFIIKLQSVYYHVSGLIPEQDSESSVSEYLEILYDHWRELSSYYDGEMFDETQWQFLGQRPQNFPTIRIAGGSQIVNSLMCKNLINVILKKFEEIKSTAVLINSIRSLFIIKAAGYWKNHYIFEKPSKSKLNFMVGISRANEIFVNVILPYLFVYYEIFGNELLSKKVLKVYNDFEQNSDNKMIKQITEGLKFYGYNSKTIYTQGMIELFRSYCSKNRCLECEIGKKIFK